jgi:hypothetical protein
MLSLLLLLFLLSLLPVLLLYLLPKRKKMISFAGIRTHDRSTVCFVEFSVFNDRDSSSIGGN